MEIPSARHRSPPKYLADSSTAVAMYDDIHTLIRNTAPYEL